MTTIIKFTVQVQSKHYTNKHFFFFRCRNFNNNNKNNDQFTYTRRFEIIGFNIIC